MSKAETNMNSNQLASDEKLTSLRDVSAIYNYNRTEQGDGTVCYFFGDTCIHVRESKDRQNIHLVPLDGDQTACGEWTDLPFSQVINYCTLLEQYLNRERK